MKRTVFAAAVTTFCLLSTASCTSGDKETVRTETVTVPASQSQSSATPTATSKLETTTAPAPIPAPAPAPEPPVPGPAPAPAPASAIMPAVTCMILQTAQDVIQEAGVFFSRSDDATGAGRMQVMDRNWVVVAQTPAAGEPVGEAEAILSVVKIGEPGDCS